MKQKRCVHGLRISLWLYRQMLKMHTPWFQASYEREMLLHYEQAFCDAWKNNGYLGVFKLWFDECVAFLPDVSKELQDQYQSALRQEVSMREFLGVVAVGSSKFIMLVAGLAAVGYWIRLSVAGAFQTSIDQSLWFVVLLDSAVLIVGLICLAFWKTVANSLD